MPAYQVSASSSGPTKFIPINLKRFKYGVGLIVTIPAGVTANVNVEVTGDPLSAGTGSQIAGNTVGVSVGAFNWNLHDVLKAITVSTNSSLAYPVTAIRLNPISVSGGTVTLSVIEAEG